MRCYIGLDIGGSKIMGGLYDLSDHLVASVKKRTKANEGVETVLEQICKVIDQLMEIENISLQGIGVGVPGIVKSNGMVAFSPNIPFSNYPLRDYLMERYQVDVKIENDVNCLIIASVKTANRGVKNAIGLFVGTGVGGGIYINSALYTGNGSAAEFGHMVVNYDGASCGCGNSGCLEAYSSKTAIQAYLRQQIKRGRDTILKASVLDDTIIKSSELKHAYDEGDVLVQEAIQRSAKYLGVASASLIHAFHPEVIIYGGGIVDSFGVPFIESIKQKALHHVLPGLVETVRFESSGLGKEESSFGPYQLVKTTTKACI